MLWGYGVCVLMLANNEETQPPKHSNTKKMPLSHETTAEVYSYPNLPQGYERAVLLVD